MNLSFQYGVKGSQSWITGLQVQNRIGNRPSLLLVSCLGTDSLGILELVYKEDTLIMIN